MTAKIIPLPIAKGSTETQGFIQPETVLKAAIEAKLDQTIVLGWQEGQFYAASSTSDTGECLYLLERLKKLLMESE